MPPTHGRRALPPRADRATRPVETPTPQSPPSPSGAAPRSPVGARPCRNRCPLALDLACSGLIPPHKSMLRPKPGPPTEARRTRGVAGAVGQGEAAPERVGLARQACVLGGRPVKTDTDAGRAAKARRWRSRQSWEQPEGRSPQPPPLRQLPAPAPPGPAGRLCSVLPQTEGMREVCRSLARGLATESGRRGSRPQPPRAPATSPARSPGSGVCENHPRTIRKLRFQAGLGFRRLPPARYQHDVSGKRLSPGGLREGGGGGGGQAVSLHLSLGSCRCVLLARRG